MNQKQFAFSIEYLKEQREKFLAAQPPTQEQKNIFQKGIKKLIDFFKF